MNSNFGLKIVPDGGLLILALVLAVPTTTISLVMAVTTWWGFGQEVPEKALWAGVGAVTVLGAHLLLATCRKAPKVRCVVAGLLWAPCVLLVCYGHLSYFLSMQQDVAARRVARVEVEQAVPIPKRPLATVLAEAGRVQAHLASASLASCLEDCGPIKARIALLNAKVRILEVEADDVRRYQNSQDKLLARREARQADPALAQLASLFGVPDSSMSLVPAILLCLMLDGVAAYGWYLALPLLRFGRSTSVSPVVLPGVTEVEVVSENPVLVTEVSKFEPEVTRVTEAVRTGLVPKLTVEQVRRFLCCGSEKAREVTRLVKGRLEAAVLPA